MDEKLYSVIFLDTAPETDWWFKKELELKTLKKFKVVSSDTHNLQGKLSKFLRYTSYFLLPLREIVCRKKYRDIVAWQQFYGLCYAFWMRLFGLKKKSKLIVMTFIYKKKNGLAGILYDKFIRYIVSGRYIDKFICFSEYECSNYAEYFGIGREKFISCGLTVVDKYDQYKEIIGKDDYYLSVGRSDRNYRYLCDEFKTLKEKVIVLCDDLRISDAPDNVHFLNGVYGDKYIKLLARCKGVIIPLKDGTVSAGQLVLLQGMMFGKICIITKTETSIEYVENGKNAILMSNQQGELAKIIKKIEEEKYIELEKKARLYYLKKFTGTELAAVVARAVQE